ncbi:hypothetical protein AB2N08_21525 [Massilia aurea]|uniref:hypothetical protein n=1 Tax=Massilia aurea TaxID=373040 RepID=UPI0034635DBA
MTSRLDFIWLTAPAASFMVCVGVLAASQSLAADANFCTSMCESAQQECRAEARSGGNERFMPPPDNTRNPLARTAESEVPGQGTRALQAAGDTHRRLDRTSACEKSYQHCTRSCSIQAATDRQAAPPRR